MAKLSTAEKQLLTQLIQPVSSKLQLAWLLSTLATLVLVIQSWVLATIFADWLQAFASKDIISTEILWQWLWLLILCFLLRPLLNLWRELIGVQASIEVRTGLRQRLLSALASLGIARQAFGSDGSLSSQVIEQTDALDAYVSRFMVQKKVVATTPIILLIACAWQNLTVALILLLTAPLVPILMIIIGKMTAKKSAEQFSALAQLSGRFLDWVRGMTTLKRLQANQQAEQDLYNASEDYRKRTMAVLKVAFLNGAVLELLSALSIALVAIYLGVSVLGDTAVVSDWQSGGQVFFSALFILLLVPEFYAPLRQLGMDYHAQSQAQGAVQSLLPLLEKADELDKLHKGSQLQNQPDNQPNNQPNNRAKNQNQTSIENNSQQAKLQNQLDYQQALAIEFQALAIEQKIKPPLKQKIEQQDEQQVEQTDTASATTHTDTHTSISRTRLMPTSFTVASTQRVGLVGESGSGKSSLLQALLGFSEYQGNIVLSCNDSDSDVHEQGHGQQRHLDHRQLAINEFRHNVGYLAQQVALLPMSIADNLRLAKPNASDDELIAVLQAVALYELIKQLPQGINTQLGERGRGLSGGQQQRLGVAQLLLRDAKLWLLDEPTEHLDADTAEQLHSLLESVSRDKTVIWITHSVEQLPWLDKVVEVGRS